jgi:L-threonylcarbamoyladenylate synthase
VRLLRAVDLRLALQAVRGARLVDLAPEAGADNPPVLAVWSRSVTNTEVQGVLHAVMPDDAPRAAQQLFAQLRAFDAQGVTEIWIESPPAASAWDGVRDRLQRAAH